MPRNIEQGSSSDEPTEKKLWRNSILKILSVANYNFTDISKGEINEDDLNDFDKQDLKEGREVLGEEVVRYIMSKGDLQEKDDSKEEHLPPIRRNRVYREEIERILSLTPRELRYEAEIYDSEVKKQEEK